jgi:hypothetical protein
MRLRAVFSSAAAVVFMFAVNSFLMAAESPGEAEAKGLLDKAVAYLDSNGVARAFCAFNDANGAFRKGPLYVCLSSTWTESTLRTVRPRRS